MTRSDSLLRRRRRVALSLLLPIAAALALPSVATGTVLAQSTPLPVHPQDPAARLRQVLPPAVAERVLARIAAARARELPAQALEQRALKFAARGVAPEDIERSVDEQATRMEEAKGALESGRGRAADDEIEAGAEAIRQGVDGAAVSALARSAPSGRSLAVPLYVIGSLAARGLPSDAALERVRDRLAAGASDSDLEQLPAQLPPSPRAAAGAERRPTMTGRDLAGTKRGVGAAGGAASDGPPAGVPANGGAGARPNRPGHATGKPPVKAPGKPPGKPTKPPGKP